MTSFACLVKSAILAKLIINEFGEVVDSVEKGNVGEFGQVLLVGEVGYLGDVGELNDVNVGEVSKVVEFGENSE